MAEGGTRVVVITGCSTGIGRATAERLAGRGHTVYATARRLESIADLEEKGCKTLSLDVTDEGSMHAAVAAVEEAEGAIGALVNNAGYSQSGAIEDVPMEQVRKQFETNVFGLIRMCQLVLPGMRKQGDGRIVNVSSMGGRLVFPGGGIYHATKHAVEALSDALRFEVRGFGVGVSIIEPGLIKTEFGHAAVGSMEGTIADDGAYGRFNREVAAKAAGVASAVVPVNEVGPKTRIQPSGRLLAPPGKLTTLGNHPGGGALTTNARFLWTLSAGRGRNDIRIVEVVTNVHCKKGPKGAACRGRRDARVGRVVQVIPMPGVDGGITMARDNRTAYVSGTPESSHKDQQSPPGTPGKQGDVIHVFHYDGNTGIAKRAGIIPVPPPAGAPLPQALPQQGDFPVGPPIPQNFPPTNTQPEPWPRDLAVSKDGKTLLAALNLADRAAIIATKTKQVRYVKVGSYPYGAAITRDGRGLISNESDGTVSVIDLKAGTKVKDIAVGAHLTHPEGIVADRRADRAYVAVAGEDRVAVIDTKTMTLWRQLNLRREPGIGTEPTQVSVDPYGCYLTSADSGEDAVALFALRRPCTITKRTVGGHSKITVKGTQLPSPDYLGRIPTASYPVFAAPEPHLKAVSWIAAKGFGVGPNPNGPNPLSKKNNDNQINTFRYLPSIFTGT